MAPRRRKPARSKLNQPKTKSESSAPPDPYQSLVAEYLAIEASSPAETDNEDGRSSKRRRVDDGLTKHKDSESDEIEDDLRPTSKQQYAYNDSDDDVTDDFSDADFEDVVLSGTRHPATGLNPTGNLDLTLSGDNEDSRKRLSAGRRKALTAADRKMRLDLHKTHVLALLGHGRVRNQWCNDSKVQAAFRGFLPTSVRKMFRDDTTQTQWQRSRSLKMGLEKALEYFKDHFQITARGTTRSYWSESPEQIDTIPEDIDLPIEKEDFQKLAVKRKGSRDLGAQLFCALLRSVGLDVRLIYSLQPLPIQAIFRPANLNRPMPVIIPFHDDRSSTLPGHTTTGSSAGAEGGPNSVPQGVRRFGHATKKVNTTPTKGPKKQDIHESSFPVYWVEVFNIADQKWIPVDPLVLKLVDKPSKYEPPANDAENNMSYVVAIDEDGYVKDVTRRYAHAYNAKTRRNRVESSKDGHKWWEHVMRIYRDPLPQDRDQVEDAELTGKEAREPMPRSIVEFKNHPYYALERHLRQNEVLQPKRQVGTVSSGGNKNIEAVYRRNDVHTVRSADAWFRKGKQVKVDEMPLKYLEPKKVQGHRTKDDELDEEEAEIPGIHSGTPLFAEYQTQQYTPPPVLNGIVPKNMYGNIDVYTPWMVPAGGVWINHPFAGGAARLLLLDWADAVTGFEFRGRTGTAVIRGVVVAGEYHEAIVETIKGLQYAIEEEELHHRSIQVLQTWKRFLIALRIRQRIKSYHVEGEELEEAAIRQSESEYNDTENDDTDNSDHGGGFLRGAHQDMSDTDNSMPPAAAAVTPHGLSKDAEPLPKALQDAMAPILSTWGEPLPTPSQIQNIPFQPPDFIHDSIDTAGGFIPDHTSLPDYTGDNGGSGGFIPEEDTNTTTLSDLMDENLTPAASSPSNPHKDTTKTEPNQERQFDTTTTIIAATTTTAATSSSTQNLPIPNRLTLLRSESAGSGMSTATSLSNKSASTSVSVDAGSLLSHDPEDDDVEPEWV